jgi:hypothetical protein
MTSNQNNKRSGTRFKPEPLDYAQIDFQSDPGAFDPSVAAVILNESPGGCSLAFASPCPIGLGGKVCIKVGNLDPVVAEVRWIKTYDDRLVALGFKYFLD